MSSDDREAGCDSAVPHFCFSDSKERCGPSREGSQSEEGAILWHTKHLARSCATCTL